MNHFKKVGLLLAAFIGLSATAGLAACGEEDSYNLQSGASTTLVTTKAPDELSPEDAIFAFLQKQSDLQSYKIVTEGKAVADLLGYVQEIHNTVYKNGADFLSYAKSESFLVDMEHQAFSKDGKVVYRDSSDGEMQVATKEEYKRIYGFTADEVTLGGFIINEKTLRYAALEKTEGDTFTYILRLAGDLSYEANTATESATTGVRLQAKAYGSLDNLPAFSDVEIHLSFKKDWTPVSYTSECSYDCKKVFNMSVVQTLSCVYTEVNASVEIPSVAQFNEKLGSTPSEVKPITGETSDLMQFTSALGAAFDENETLSLPFTAKLDLFGAPFTVGGELSLKLKRESLNKGDMLNAFTLRADIDLSAIPLLSQYVNTFTVRYLGEGELFLMLNNRTEGKDRYLVTYPLGLEQIAPELGGKEFSLEQLQALMESLFDLEKTDTGYHISLKQTFVALLNTGYGNLLEQAETQAAAMLGGAHGYLRSFLGTTFTALTLDVSGTDKVTALALTVAGTPAENTTMGEKIDVSLDIGLLNSSGLFGGAFEGDLQLRLNPSAVWSQNFYAIAQGKLHLGLTSAQPILQMLGALGSMIPDLPSWISADLNSLDVYYAGDGVLTLALNNIAGDPVFTTDVDLTQLISAATAPDGESGGTQGLQELQIPQLIFEIKENGFAVSLGENLVQALNTAYQSLVQTAVDYVTEAAGGDMMGALAGQMIGGWLGAEITGAGIFVGKTDEGKLTFNLNVDGIPQINGDSEIVSLLSITLTHNGELESAEKEIILAVGERIKELREMNAKAAEYDAQVQKLIDEMDVSKTGYTQYVANVTALQEKIASEASGVKSLMTTKSYLAEKTYQDKQYSVLLLTAQLYYERAETFKEKLAAIEDSSSETDWDELNALYDNSTAVQGIAVPAINGNEVLEAAVGEDTLESYLEKRSAHEDTIVQTLLSQIETSKATYQNATDRDDLTKALTEIVTEFKPVYDKLPAAKKANAVGYSEYVKDIYLKNIDGVMAEYKAVQTELEELDENEDVTIDELLAAMKKLSSAYAWGYGYDYWVTNTIKKVQPWGTTWITSLKPKDLSEGEQAKISDLNTLNRSFMKGEIATSLSKYTDLIITEVSDLYEKIKTCRIVGDDGKDEWKFGTLGEEADELLETIHGLRFLICKVLPSSINDEFGKESPELNQFARIDLTKYEEALVEYLTATSDD